MYRYRDWSGAGQVHLLSSCDFYCTLHNYWLHTPITEKVHPEHESGRFKKKNPLRSHKETYYCYQKEPTQTKTTKKKKKRNKNKQNQRINDPKTPSAYILISVQWYCEVQLHFTSVQKLKCIIACDYCDMCCKWAHLHVLAVERDLFVWQCYVWQQCYLVNVLQLVHLVARTRCWDGY